MLNQVKLLTRKPYTHNAYVFNGTIQCFHCSNVVVIMAIIIIIIIIIIVIIFIQGIYNNIPEANHISSI
jgi:hypothetical protein